MIYDGEGALVLVMYLNIYTCCIYQPHVSIIYMLHIIFLNVYYEAQSIRSFFLYNIPCDIGGKQELIDVNPIFNRRFVGKECEC